MNLLAIDTSMQACSAAVLTGDDDTQIHGVYEEIERGHAERLMSMIDEALEKAGVSITQIDQFAVSRGPGTFTGVRIGIATARGLALARNKPLVGIGTLQVLAARVLFERPEFKNQTEQDLGICIDARRGEIYWQLFDMNAQPTDEPVALTPQNIAASLKSRHKPLVLAGSGSALIQQYLPETLPITSTHAQLQPDAARLVELVTGMKLDARSMNESISPFYLRPADAKIQTGFAIKRQ